VSKMRPNILWVCTDQQRWDTIHSLGNEHIRTPHVDRLVAEGTAFTRCYSQSPICTPSRSNFLTGCYPSTLHVNRNGNEFFPCPERLITRRLRDAGYDCGLAGKLHIAGAHKRVEPRTDDGYRFFRWSHHPYPEAFWPNEHHHYQAWLEEQGVDWQAAYGERGRGICHIGIEARFHQTTWCANEAIAFMSEERDRPWLMSVNPFDPHPPFDPPAEYMDRMDVASMPLPRFQAEEIQSQLAFAEIDHQTREPVSPHDYDARRMLAAYYAQIELIDDQVGRMLEALDQTGQADDTIVIFMSDHGDCVGDHGLLRKGCRFHEGSVRVPLVIRWPGRVQAGLRSDALVELTDVPVALMEATGLPVPEDTHGKSILPILTGEADPGHHRDFVRCEYHDAMPGRDASRANMIVDERYKLCIYHGHGIGELYDLHDDPCEFYNLWDDASHQAVRHDLVKRIFDAVMLATDDGQRRVGAF